MNEEDAWAYEEGGSHILCLPPVPHRAAKCNVTSGDVVIARVCTSVVWKYEYCISNGRMVRVKYYYAKFTETSKVTQIQNPFDSHQLSEFH